MTTPATLPFWRVVFLIEPANPRHRPVPLPMKVQADTAENAKTKAQTIVDRVVAKRGLRAIGACFVTEARA